MGSPNGHAAENSPPSVQTAVPFASPSTPHRATSEIKDVIAKLEIPFHPSVIVWRVTNTVKAKPGRGQVIPYADQRAYTDRLNELFTPAGWTREYNVNTTANFQRGKDQKTVAKIVITCELEIFGFGAHSATGEEWADDDNAATSAEAQSFKRACSCFGLGRYLYHFTGVWVDLDEHKRPKKLPTLPGWATPEGWLKGLRPGPCVEASAPGAHSRPAVPARREPTDNNAVELIRQIEALQEPLGRGLYRGLLRTIARVWQPRAIEDVAVLQNVLKRMQSAQRGLLRLDAAVNTLGQDTLKSVLRQLNLRSLDSVNDLKKLEQVVLALETLVGEAGR
jgi:Rad52/22 family double-strand break repair protein